MQRLLQFGLTDAASYGARGAKPPFWAFWRLMNPGRTGAIEDRGPANPLVSCIRKNRIVLICSIVKSFFCFNYSAFHCDIINVFLLFTKYDAQLRRPVPNILFSVDARPK